MLCVYNFDSVAETDGRVIGYAHAKLTARVTTSEN